MWKNQNQKEKQVPSASNCLFPEPEGLPLCFFAGASADGVPPESPPPDTAVDEGDACVVANPRAMLPSGEYFLGRPLFFLASPPSAEHGFIADEAPPLKGSEGLAGGGGAAEPKGNRAVAGAMTTAGELGETMALGEA